MIKAHTFAGVFKEDSTEEYDAATFDRGIKKNIQVEIANEPRTLASLTYGINSTQ